VAGIHDTTPKLAIRRPVAFNAPAAERNGADAQKTPRFGRREEDRVRNPSTATLSAVGYRRLAVQVSVEGNGSAKNADYLRATRIHNWAFRYGNAALCEFERPSCRSWRR